MWSWQFRWAMWFQLRGDRKFSIEIASLGKIAGPNCLCKQTFTKSKLLFFKVLELNRLCPKYMKCKTQRASSAHTGRQGRHEWFWSTNILIDIRRTGQLPKSTCQKRSTTTFQSFCVQVDFLSSWLFGKLTLCQVDSLSSWLFVKLTLCQVDSLSSWIFGKLNFWQVDF